MRPPRVAPALLAPRPPQTRQPGGTGRSQGAEAKHRERSLEEDLFEAAVLASNPERADATSGLALEVQPAATPSVYDETVDVKAREQEVNNLVQALGYRFELAVHASDDWTFDAATGELTYPRALLESENPRRIVAELARETARVFYTRPVASPGADPLLRYLYAVVDELRVVRMFGERYPGTAKWMRALYPTADRAPTLFGQKRTLQFGQAIAYAFANGGELPPHLRPEVRQAVVDSRAALEEAIHGTTDANLRIDELTEEQTVDAAARAYDVVVQKLLPTMRTLYQQDVYDALSQDGQSSKTGDPKKQGAGGQGSPQQPSEADPAQARDAVDEELAEAAQDHAQKVTDPSEEPRARMDETSGAARSSEESPRSPDGQVESSPQSEDAAEVPLDSDDGEEDPGTKSLEDALFAAAREAAAQNPEGEEGSQPSTKNLSYGERAEILAPSIDALVNELEAVIEEDEQGKVTGFFRSGKLDRRRANQAALKERATGELDPFQFVRRTDPEGRSAEFVLAIDTSVSMDQKNKLESAKDALVVFSEALSRLEIRHGVLAFEEHPHVVKPLDQTTDELTKSTLFSKLKGPARSGTNDVATLEAAKALLAEGDAGAAKIVIFITDGEGKPEQAAEVEKALDEGIVVVGIGLGPGTEHVKASYPHTFVQVPDIERLPLELGELLKDLLYAAQNRS